MALLCQDHSENEDAYDGCRRLILLYTVAVEDVTWGRREVKEQAE